MNSTEKTINIRAVRFYCSIAILVFLLFTFNITNAQSDLIISGGNSVSSLVCANKRVFTWGNNIDQNTIGILGTGNTTDEYITVPTEVIGFPANLDISQVNSGSGNHFVALDCNSGVWAWGNNAHGQVGNGESGNAKTSPHRVLAGVLQGTAFDDGNGFLTGAVTVFAGNSNTFAILNDGRLVAWGGNSGTTNPPTSGQLGDGTTINRSTPVFVTAGDSRFGQTANQPLQGVIEVYAGDMVAMALVDLDGDGVGIVYSWGTSPQNQLGRNADGTVNPNNATELTSSRAYPVVDDEGNPLDNITQITVGDVTSFALDVNGYVWAWGNDHNGSDGDGVNGNANQGSKLRLVAAGEATGAGSDGTYLLARQIGAGQANGMAVTMDNKPVAWGGGTCTACLGNGTTGISDAPVYIINGETGEVDDNVILINKGDLWGFYATRDNEFYAWGQNNFGQLGIGSTTNQTTAVRMTPPTNCGFQDPRPRVNLYPRDTLVCMSSFTTSILRTGFDVNSSIDNSYEVTWYKDGVQVAQGPPSTHANYIIDDIGTYRAEIEYIGSNGACNGYPIAFGETEVAYAIPPYEAPDGLEFCIDDIMPNVLGDGYYYWYADMIDGDALGVSEEDNPTQSPLDASTMTPISTNPDVYRFWVDDVASYSGNLRTNEGDFSNPQTYASPILNDEGNIETIGELGPLTFDAHTDFIILEMDVVIRCGDAKKKNVGILLFDNTGTLIGSSDVEVLCPQGNINHRVKLQDVGLYIPEANGLRIGTRPAGNDYYSTVSYVNGLANWFPEINRIEGNDVITITSNNSQTPTENYTPDNAWGSPALFNWKIEKGTPYPCGRVPVDVTIKDPSECSPCTKDTLVVRCANDNIIDLSELEDYVTCKHIQANSSTVSWLEANETPIATPDAYPATNGTSVIARVFGNGKEEDAIVTFEINPLPVVSLDISTEFPVCEVADQTIDFTQLALPYGAGYISQFSSEPENITTAGIFDASEDDSWEVKYLVEDIITGCKDSVTVTAIVNPKPVIEFTTTAPYVYCANETGANIAIEPITGATYSWTQDGTDAARTSNSITATGTSTGSEWIVTATYSLTLCSSSSEPVTVIENQLPTYNFTGGDTYCNGADREPLVLEITGTPNYTISYEHNGQLPETGTATTNIFEIEDPLVGEYCITEIKDGNECTITINDACEEVIEKDPIVIVTQANSICSDIDNNNLRTALIVSEPTGGSGIFTSVSPSGTITQAGIFTHGGVSEEYTVEYTFTDDDGCEELVTETFVVNESLLPTITGSPSLEACKGGTIELGTSVAYSTYEWSGVASANLSSTTIPAPVFNANLDEGDYTIEVKVTDANGCEGTAVETITVNPIPTGNFADVDPACEGGDNLSLSVSVVPSGGEGTFSSSTLIIDSETGEIDIANSDVNPLGHTIEYNYTSSSADGTCVMPTIETTLIINPKPLLSINYPSYNATRGICVSALPIQAVLSHDLVNGSLSIEPATTALNLTTGEFTPSLAQAGTYTIKYNYTSTDGCVGDEAITTIRVNALPIPIISSNPSAVCDYSPSFQLVATIDNVNLTGGTFSGSGVTGGTHFNPSSAGTSGAYTITYNYTDPTTLCAALPVTHVITVNSTPELEAITQSAINTDVTNQTQVPELCPEGTSIEWFSSTNTNNSTISTDDCYQFTYIDDTDDPGRMASGSYTVYATQTLNGCKSNPVAMTLIITNCPIALPTVVPHYFCDGDTDITVSAIGSGDGSHLGWWTDAANIPTSPTDGDEDYKGNSWNSHGYSGVGEYTVYVADYLASNNCYGPAAELRIIVKELPNPRIEDPGMICYNTPPVNLSPSPSYAVVTGAGITQSGTDYIWTPQINDENVTEISTTTLTATASRVWGENTIGEATCTNSNTIDVSVTNVIAPTGTGISPNEQVVIGYENVHELEDMVINTNLDAFSTVRVRNSDEIVYQGISDVISYETYLDNTNSEVLYIRSNDNITSSNVQHIQASAWSYDGTFGIVRSFIQFWNIDIPDNAIIEDVSISFSFRDNAFNETHETILPALNNDAYLERIPQMWNSTDIDWFNQPASVATNRAYLPSSTSARQDYLDIDITDMFIDMRNAENPFYSFVFKQVTEERYSRLLFASSNNPDASARPLIKINYRVNTNDVINLYTEGLIDNTPDKLYEYDVTQTLNGCTSPVAVSSWFVVDCPTPEPEISDIEICYGSNDPTFEWTMGDDVEWYDANQDLIHSGATFTPADIDATYSEVGEYTFYVSQMQLNPHTNIMCRGKLGEFKLTILPLPEFDITLSKTTAVCYDDSDLEIIVNNNSSNTISNIEYSVDGLADIIQAGSSRGYFNPRNADLGIIRYIDYGLHTYDVEVTVTDNKSCVFTNNVEVQLQYTAPPTLTGVNDLTGLDPNIFAEVSALETNVRWYRNANRTNFLSTDNPYNTLLPYTNETNTPFYATQTIEGCESDTAEARVILNNCPVPTPNPIVAGPYCPYSTLEAMVATSPDDASWILPPTGADREYRWYPYSAGATYQPGQTYIAAAEYTPNETSLNDIALNDIGLLTAGTYRWYVAEYEDGYGCESPTRRLVQITINQTLPTTADVLQDVCEGDAMGTFRANGTAGAIHWYTSEPNISAPQPGISDGTRFFQVPMMPSGDYPIWMSVFDNGCYSIPTELTYRIKTKPQPPMVEDFWVCADFEDNPELTAIPSLTSNTIRWYDSNMTTVSNVHTNRTANEYIYNATQVQEGCESDAAELKLTVRAVPDFATVASKTMCNYSELPKFEISGNANISIWKEGILLADGVNSYTPTTADTTSHTGRVLFQAVHTDNECSSTIDFSLQIYSRAPIPDLRTSVNNICDGSSHLPLYANGINVKWFENDSLIREGNSFNINSYILEKDARNYIFEATATSQHGCESFPLQVNFEVFELPESPELISDNTFCEGTFPIILTTDVPSYWKNANNETISSPNALREEFELPQGYSIVRNGRALETHTFYAITKDDNNCESEPSMIIVTVNETPQLFATDSMPLCFGDEVQPLFVFGLGEIVWYSNSGEFLSVGNEYTPTELMVQDSIYKYKVQLTDETTLCKSDTLVLTLYSAPIPNTKILGKDRVCEQTYKEIYSITEFNNQNYYTWEYIGQERLRILRGSNGQSIEIDWDVQGIDTLVLKETTPYECSGIDTIVVSVAQKPDVDFDWSFPGAQLSSTFHNITIQEPIVDNGDTIEVTYTSYWNYGREQDIFPNIHSYNQRHRVDTVRYKYGNYTVTLEVLNDHGCRNSIDYNVFVDVNYGLYVPNAFAPNNTSKAVGEFLPRGYNLETYNMSIYDLWGNLLFYTDKLTSDGRPAEPWLGTYNGMPLKSDTYIWKIEASFIDGSKWEGIENAKGKKNKFGNVVLIR